MMTISEFSRASGLTVSALRFYDSVGALVPAHVDPQTSYRWYADSQVADGRLVSRLRRVGMPVAQMRSFVDRRDDPALVSALLAEHLGRLEQGLEAARAELARIRSDVGISADLGNRAETGIESATSGTASAAMDLVAATQFSVKASQLSAALNSVLFALPDSPDPILGAVLLDIGPTSVTLVTSDRYRLAVSEVSVGDRGGPSTKAAVPRDRLPALHRFLAGEGALTVNVDDTVNVDVCGLISHWRIADRRLELSLSCEEFPEYRSIVDVPGTRRVITSAENVRALMASRPAALGRGTDDSTVDVAILAVTESGALVARSEAEAQDCVVVNIDFLMEAIDMEDAQAIDMEDAQAIDMEDAQATDANPAGQLLLDFASPITPLAIRFQNRPGTFSVLMPTRLS